MKYILTTYISIDYSMKCIVSRIWLTLCIRDCSEKNYCEEGWNLFDFRKNLGAHPSRIGRIWVTTPPPPYTYYLITPLYVIYGLVWAVSVFLIISVWSYLGIQCVNEICTEFAFAHPKYRATLLQIYGTIFYASNL